MIGEIIMRRSVIVCLALAMLVAACGSDPTSVTADLDGTSSPVEAAASTSAPATSTVDTSVATSDTAVPTTDTTSTSAVVVGHSIVSLSSTATEMLFAIDAGDLVVAVDEFSNYPAQAPTTELSGFTPSVEAIATFEPTLVVAQFDPGDLVAGLEALGIEVVLLPSASSLDEVYSQITQLGEAVDREPEASELVSSIKTTLEVLVADLPARATPITYFHEVGTEYYSATSMTFVGEIYALAGMVNIADAADLDGSQFGFPLLTEEYILDADPDIIFLADTIGYGQTAAVVADRPGWESLTAVVGGRIVELNDDLAARWGPRVVELAEAIFAAVGAFDAAG
jgi:iron complex transport system substrate-binding protein